MLSGILQSSSSNVVQDPDKGWSYMSRYKSDPLSIWESRAGNRPTDPEHEIPFQIILKAVKSDDFSLLLDSVLVTYKRTNCLIL